MRENRDERMPGSRAAGEYAEGRGPSAEGEGRPAGEKGGLGHPEGVN